jgi:hypothetical protein
MLTQDRFDPDHSLPLFLADEPQPQDDEPQPQDIAKRWDRAAMLSRAAKLSILVVMAIAVGVAVRSVGNPVMLFADVSAPLVGKSELKPASDQSAPTIQSTADAEPQSNADAQPQSNADAEPQFIARETLAPTDNAPTRREFAAAAPQAAAQSQTEKNEHEALFRQFQAWVAEQDAQAQLAENARAPLQTTQKNSRSVQTARAEVGSVPTPRKKVRREQNARGPNSEAQDQSIQNAQSPSLLQILRFRN